MRAKLGDSSPPVRMENTISYFYEQLGKGSLVGARCKKCRALYVPPEPLCSRCYTRDLKTQKLSGSGNIITFTVVHVAPAVLQDLAPYTVAVIALKEGVSVIGILRDAKNPEDIIIGGEVVVDFESSAKITPGTVRLVFGSKKAS